MLFTASPSGTLFCDLESKPRALGMMKFFDRHISSTVMRITAAAISNEVLVVKKHWLGPTMVVHYDRIFNDDDMYHNYNMMDEEIEDIGVKDSEYRAEKFYVKHDRGKSRKSLDSLAVRLGLKERIIFKRSVVGNSACNAMDTLNEMAEEYCKDSNKK